MTHWGRGWLRLKVCQAFVIGDWCLSSSGSFLFRFSLKRESNYLRVVNLVETRCASRNTLGKFWDGHYVQYVALCISCFPIVNREWRERLEITWAHYGRKVTSKFVFKVHSQFDIAESIDGGKIRSVSAHLCFPSGLQTPRGKWKYRKSAIGNRQSDIQSANCHNIRDFWLRGWERITNLEK